VRINWETPMANDNDTSFRSPSSHPALSGADGMADQGRDLILLLGRVLLGWIFMQSGWRKLQDIPAFVATMPRRGLPDFLGWVAPPVEFIGGLAMLAGIGTRYVALVMLLFTIIATFSSHAYWTYPLKQQAGQASHFWKNVSMMGGIVLLFVTAGGRLSLDSLLRRK
jgi:putative oxidoreductase